MVQVLVIVELLVDVRVCCVECDNAVVALIDDAEYGIIVDVDQ